MCLLIIKQVFRSSYLSQCCEFFCFRKIIRIQLVTRVLSSRVMRSWNFVFRSVIRHVANVILSSFIHYAIFFSLFPNGEFFFGRVLIWKEMGKNVWIVNSNAYLVEDAFPLCCICMQRMMSRIEYCWVLYLQPVESNFDISLQAKRKQ